MDSKGNPGTAGNTIGVETEALVTDVLTTVMVATDVLTEVTVSELVVVTGWVARDVVNVDSDVLVLVCETVELVVVCVEFSAVVVACYSCPTTLGLSGSRWKIPARGTVVVPEGPVPTLQPSCAFPGCPYTEFSARPGAIGGEIVVAVQICPSQCTKTACAVLPFSVVPPTAQPSPLPEPVLGLSMYTDLRAEPVGFGSPAI